MKELGGSPFAVSSQRVGYSRSKPHSPNRPSRRADPGTENYNRLPMFESKQRELPSAVRFGDYELDPKRGVLSRNGITLKLQPQPFRVLELLVARAPNIVTREEISDYVWGDGVYVDLDQSLNFCIRQIRSVLNDTASNPKFVDTLPKQGYRFIGSVVEVATPSTEEQSQQSSLESRNRRIGDIKPAPTSNGTCLLQSRGTRQRRTTKRRSRTATKPERPATQLSSYNLALRISRSRSTHRCRSRRTQSAKSHPQSLRSAKDHFTCGPSTRQPLRRSQPELLRRRHDRRAHHHARQELQPPHRLPNLRHAIQGSPPPPPEIARELGVDGVLEGSIARTGNKVHMTIQLIQAPTDTHIWAESYDRDANDVVSLPKEAAQTIANRLGSATLQPTPARYVNPEAHDAYLRGRYIWFQWRQRSSRQVLQKSNRTATGLRARLGWTCHLLRPRRLRRSRPKNCHSAGNRSSQQSNRTRSLASLGAPRTWREHVL